MPVLHNRISNEELKARMLAETEPRKTVSFYQYFPIADPQQFRDELYKKFFALNVFGRIYIAQEGINAQISVLLEILSRCPLYFSQGPAMEIWSVVHFPKALISRRSPFRSVPSQEAKGSSSCRRSLSGLTSTSTLEPSTAGACRNT